jgi:hypothetical protein
LTPEVAHNPATESTLTVTAPVDGAAGSQVGCTIADVTPLQPPQPVAKISGSSDSGCRDPPCLADLLLKQFRRTANAAMHFGAVPDCLLGIRHLDQRGRDDARHDQQQTGRKQQLDQGEAGGAAKSLHNNLRTATPSAPILSTSG